jgi:hypothetical protein
MKKASKTVKQGKKLGGVKPLSKLKNLKLPYR